MIFLIRLLVQRDFRIYYPSYWSYIIEVVSVTIGLTVYWFTSKALSPNLDPSLNWYGQDYFSYVILGELIISVPNQTLGGFIRSSNAIITQGLMDQLLMIPNGLKRYFQSTMLSQLVREFFNIGVTLIIATSLFGFSVSGKTLLIGGFMILLSLPAFFGLGAIAVAITLRFGRGQGILNQINFLTAVLSGAYFPVTVFPTQIATLLTYGSPLTATLQGTRQLALGNWNEGLSIALALLAWDVILVLSGMVALSWAHQAAKLNPSRSHILR